MPADFTALDTDRGNVANLFGFATGFGTRVKAFIDRCFGTANPFGTAAQRNAEGGRSGGGVPRLLAGGKLNVLQTSAATSTEKGTAAIGNAQSAGTRTVQGFQFPVCVTADAAKEQIDSLSDIIQAGRFSLDRLQLRNYGPSGALKTAFVVPQYAALIFISANGGTRHSRNLTADGDGISIVDVDGSNIVTIRGGDAGFVSAQRVSSGLPTSPATRYSPTTAIDYLDVLGDDALTKLGLSFGVILKRAGAPGSPHENRGAGGIAGPGSGADLFVGMKGVTTSSLWLTDNPAPPYFERPSDFGRVGNDKRFLGFAYSIRVR